MKGRYHDDIRALIDEQDDWREVYDETDLPVAVMDVSASVRLIKSPRMSKRKRGERGQRKHDRWLLHICCEYASGYRDYQDDGWLVEALGIERGGREAA